MKIILNTDGGARGNPGPGAIGIVIRDSNENIVFELGKYIGTCTNNEAEYQALICGLENTIGKYNGKSINLSCYLDSELVVKQLTGLYKVKDARMKMYWDKVKKLEKAFTKVTYGHVPRIKNKEADALVNKVLDEL